MRYEEDIMHTKIVGTLLMRDWMFLNFYLPQFIFKEILQC